MIIPKSKTIHTYTLTLKCSKSTMTHGIQSKISVWLSLIRGRSQSKTFVQQSRAFYVRKKVCRHYISLFGNYTQSQKKRNFSSWIFPRAQGQGHVTLDHNLESLALTRVSRTEYFRKGTCMFLWVTSVYRYFQKGTICCEGHEICSSHNSFDPTSSMAIENDWSVV